MTQLQQSDVDALRCAFVHSIHAYIRCRKYSLTCCIDTATQDFLNYKLATATCTLGEDDTCRLVNAVEPTLAVTCTTEVPCSAQAAITIKNTAGPLLYTPTIINADFATSAPVFSARGDVTLTPNSIYHDAALTVGIIDQNFDIIDSVVFKTGKAKINGILYTNDVYRLKLATVFGLNNVSNLAAGYMKTIRIYYTNNAGQFVPSQYWDIDVSITSPYLACGTCTPVLAADLYFASPNWTTAIKTVVDNAIRDLTGDVNIDFRAEKYTDKVIFYTTVKHLPESTWCGLRPADFVFWYTNGTQNFKGSTSTVGPAFFPTGAGNLYGEHTFGLVCDAKTIEIKNVSMKFDGIVNQSTSEFNEIKLISNKTFLAGTITDTSTLDCSSNTYTATVSSNEVITSVQWLNSFLTIIATGYTFTPVTIGDYICRVTLASGCVIDTPFTVDAAQVPAIYLITEDGDYIVTEDSFKIKI